MALTKVYAVERGHDGRLVREAGETFDLDLDDPRFAKSTWFKPVNSPEAAKAKADAAAKAKAKADPKARPPGAGPAPGSASKDEPAPGEPIPAAGGDIV